MSRFLWFTVYNIHKYSISNNMKKRKKQRKNFMTKHGIKESLAAKISPINNTIAQNYTRHTKLPKRYNSHLNSAIDVVVQ